MVRVDGCVPLCIPSCHTTIFNSAQNGIASVCIISVPSLLRRCLTICSCGAGGQYCPQSSLLEPYRYLLSSFPFLLPPFVSQHPPALRVSLCISGWLCTCDVAHLQGGGFQVWTIPWALAPHSNHSSCACCL